MQKAGVQRLSEDRKGQVMATFLAGAMIGSILTTILLAVMWIGGREDE